MLGPAGRAGAQRGQGWGRPPPATPAPCCLSRAFIITETGKAIYFHPPLPSPLGRVHFSFHLPPLHPHYPSAPPLPHFPQNTSHLSAVEGSSFPRRCCFARSALSPFPQAGQDSQLCPAGLCPRDVPVGHPDRAHCMGGTGLQAPQPGGDMARRVGDHPNITHGQWPDPLLGLSSLCPSWAGWGSHPRHWSGAGPGAVWGHTCCLRGQEVCFGKVGWRGARCLSRKMCIIALSCLGQRERLRWPLAGSHKAELRP